MKIKVSTTLKVIVSTVLAVAAAFLVRYAYLNVAESSDGKSITSQFDNEMLIARSMFVEKSDDIQALTAAIVDKSALTVMRAEDGSPMLVQDGTAVSKFSLDEKSSQSSLENVFGDYRNGGKIQNIEVTSDAVIYYTYYNNSGCTGFIYEKEPGTTSYYQYFDLLENWKLFYKIPS